MEIKRRPIIQCFNIKFPSNRIVPNDTVFQAISDLPNYSSRAKGYEEPIGNNAYRYFLEEEKHLDFFILEKTTKKYGEVITKLTISLIGDYVDTTPINRFDMEVLIECLNFQQYRNEVTTIPAIFRAMTNNKNGLGNGMKEKIKDSIRRLMYTGIKIDLNEAYKKMGWNIPSKDDKEDKLAPFESAILPACILPAAKINGQVVEEVIKFDRPSPLFLVAQLKKHILTYARYLLAAPKIENSEQNIVLKSYILKRTLVAKEHPRKESKNGKESGLQPVLNFDTIYRDLNLTNEDKFKKQRVRKTIFKYLDYLSICEIIDHYEVIKSGNEYKSINLTF